MSENVAHQRNANGTFAAGHTVNAGRRRKNLLTTMREAVLEEVAPDELAMIVRMQANKALGGDLKAAIFIRDTVIGKPLRQIEDSEDKGRLVEIVELIKVAQDAAG